MAKSASFDIVSEFDPAELSNAVDQTRKEIRGRYDLKGSDADIELIEDKTKILLKGDEYQLDVVLDILRAKFAKRGVDQKVLDCSVKKEEGNPWRWTIPLKKGISTEDAKKINKKIRDVYPKVKPQIQGDAVRISSSSKDELQAVMQLVKGLDLDFAVSFNNFR